MKIAIIGSGIAGNVVAHRLHRAHDITGHQAASHIGGHTHTHSVEQAGRRHEVDTGFIAFNDRNYPHFTALLEEIGVASQESSMSFSMRNEARDRVEHESGIRPAGPVRLLTHLRTFGRCFNPVSFHCAPSATPRVSAACGGITSAAARRASPSAR